MANKKISELNTLILVDNNDVLPIVDISENETKKVSIDDLSKKVNESDIYSTNETVIGKWVDNKTLYRKVFSGVAQEHTVSISINTDLPVDTAILCRIAMLRTSDWENGYYVSPEDFHRAWFRKANNTIQIRLADREYSMPYFIILEYTKITD